MHVDERRRDEAADGVDHLSGLARYGRANRGDAPVAYGDILAGAAVGESGIA
jgi:hypothetical protein